MDGGLATGVRQGGVCCLQTHNTAPREPDTQPRSQGIRRAARLPGHGGWGTRDRCVAGRGLLFTDPRPRTPGTGLPAPIPGNQAHEQQVFRGLVDGGLATGVRQGGVCCLQSLEPHCSYLCMTSSPGDRVFHHDFDFDPSHGYTQEQFLAIEPPEAPDGFDAFWRETYEANASIPLQLERRQVESPDSSRDLFEVFFDTWDGYRAGAWLTVPKGRQPSCGFVTSHGYSGRDAADFNPIVSDAVEIFPCCAGLRPVGVRRCAGACRQPRAAPYQRPRPVCHSRLRRGRLVGGVGTSGHVSGSGPTGSTSPDPASAAAWERFHWRGMNAFDEGI